MAEGGDREKQKKNEFSDEGYRPLRDDILAEPTRVSLKKSGASGGESSGPEGPLESPKLPAQTSRPAKPKIEDTKEELVFDRIKWVAVGVVGLVIVGFVGVLSYNLLLSDGSSDAQGPGEISRLLDPEVFAEEYLEANGGVDFLRSLVSIRATGKITNNEGTFEFYLLKRIPDKTIYRLEIDRTTVTIGTDGEDPWRSISLDGKIRQVVLLEGEEADSVKKNARFFGGLMDALLEGKGDLDLIALDESGENPLIRISVVEEGGGVTEYFVDPESLDLVRSENRADGRVTTQLYSDYRSLSSFRQPFIVETVVNGERESLLTLDDATINPGVLSISFKVPETTAIGLRDGRWSMEEEVRMKQLAE